VEPSVNASVAFQSSSTSVRFADDDRDAFQDAEDGSAEEEAVRIIDAAKSSPVTDALDADGDALLTRSSGDRFRFTLALAVRRVASPAYEAVVTAE